MQFQPNGYINQIALIQPSPAGYWLCSFACGLITAKSAQSEQSVKYCCPASLSQADRMRNGWERFTTPLCSTIPSSLSFHPSSVCLFFPHFSVLPSRSPTYSSCSLPRQSLPTLSHFSPLIHLPDFTRTQGDPGQTSCRGNRQSRNILYFFIIFFFFFYEREESS